MARKRFWFERARDRRRKRVRRPPPQSGWKLVELAHLAGVSPRTVTAYLGHGLLTAPEFRGTATRYEREHLLRLMGIRLCKLDGERRLQAVKRKLETMGSRELEAWVGSRELPKAARAALGLDMPSAATPSLVGERPALSRDSPFTADVRLGDTWTRLTLLPGLELSFRDDASPAVRQIAAHLSEYVTNLVAAGTQTNASTERGEAASPVRARSYSA